jgi:hypothetical protein
MIRKKGDKWCVYSKDGEKLGEHDPRAGALRQLRAIEARKHADGAMRVYRAGKASKRGGY